MHLSLEKVKLEILAISYSRSQTGAYALILAEVNGKRKLPIIIGAFEAQAIAVAIEKIKPSRPLTHDLFKNFAETFKIDLKEVIVDKYAEGVFFAKLVCVHNKKEIEIDSRTSDAIALAIRFNCPIYTYESVFSIAGMIIDIDERVSKNKDEGNIEDEEGDNEYAQYSIEELNELLNKAIEAEEYEKASKIRDEINKRK